MPWASGNFTRTDGTRTGTTVWAQAKAALVKIIAADHDTHDQDLATGIDSCLNKDGSNAATGDLDLGNNQITNVGAGSSTTDAATIGGTETLTNKTLTTPKIAQINDANGNETLILSATASAVNEITIANAATGNAPVIGTSGESDIGIEFHNAASEEMLVLASVASAVNELTISNAATGNAPSIAVSGETNVNLELTPAGTGRVTEGGAPICRIKTGSYTGDGSTSQAITGVGFSPKYLFISMAGSDGDSPVSGYTTDTIMPLDAQGLAVIVGTTGNKTTLDNRFLSLDADGFTVSDDSADAFPNANGITHHYLAFG